MKFQAFKEVSLLCIFLSKFMYIPISPKFLFVGNVSFYNHEIVAEI